MSERDKIIIVGAGGHAKVILSTLKTLSENIVGLIDDNPILQNTEMHGYKIIGNISLLNDWQGSAICALGDNKLRAQVVSSFPNIHWITAIHPRAYVHESTKMGAGTVVLAGAVIQPDVILGNHVIINTSTSLDHDCCIDSFSHIAPGSHLGGNVRIGEGTLIGLGSSIKPGTNIGSWSTIGAGSVVVKNIASNVLAKGVPAKVCRRSRAEVSHLAVAED